MIIIPGWIIAVLTFPGVIVHEAAHMLFCRIGKVGILDVCFFRVGNPAGYVVHEEIKNFNLAFFVSVGPLIVNSLLCVFICFPAFLPVRVFDLTDIPSYVMLWLGVSIGMHAFPSIQDAAILWKEASKAVKSFNPLAIVSFPLVGLIMIANLLSVIWFDAIYGFAIGILLPELIFSKL
jgi:hypothetical protein